MQVAAMADYEPRMLRITAYADIADSLKKVAWGFLRVAASNGLMSALNHFRMKPIKLSS